MRDSISVLDQKGDGLVIVWEDHNYPISDVIESINKGVTDIMNKKLNLIEILKDCPIGTKLYSPLFGEVIFDGIDEAWDCDNQKLKSIVVITETTDSESFSEYGVYLSFSYYDDSECMLFPSKDQRDWSKFNQQ